MKLRRADIEAFGTLDGPLSVDFGDALTLVHGSNESGKSTLLRAIWTALTWRPTTTHDFVTDMYPHRGGTPRVGLEFERNGETIRLDKHFDDEEGRAQLVVEGGEDCEHVEGEAVERRLREILEMGESKGRNAYPGHYGLWPLLWIRQWESRCNPGELEALTDAGRTRVARQLAQSMDEVLGGRFGASIMEEVDEAFGEFWTPTGRPTGRKSAEIVEVREAVEAAEAELESLRQKADHYRETLEARRRAERKVERMEARLPALRDDLEEAERRVERIERTQRSLEEARSRLGAAEAEAECAIRCVERREQLRERLREARTERRDVDEAFEKLDEAWTRQRAEVSELRKKLEAKLGRERGLDRRLHLLRTAYERLLERLVPGEVDVARDLSEEAEAELDEVLEACIRAGGECRESAEALEEVRSRVEPVRRKLVEARRTVRALRSELDSCRQKAEALREQRAERAERLEALDRRIAELEGELERHVEAYGDDDTIERQKREAVRARRLAREEVEQLRRTCETFDPEEAEAELEERRATLESHRDELEQIRRRTLALTVELESADVDGIEGRISEAEAELEQQREKLEQLERRADTWKLLRSTIRDAREELTSTILAPLRERLIDSVRRLDDETRRLDVDESLRIDGVYRDGAVCESFDQLSGGTSEQFGVLVRLELARLLNEADTYPLVLDEPFAATDGERFEAMAPLIAEATDDVQMICTTWHRERYRHLDLDSARVHDLDALRADDAEVAS